MKNDKLISQLKKLRKSLDIVKGHKLSLYKTDYMVMDTNDKYTFLKDPNGNPVAFETTKLKEVLTRCMTDSIKKSAVVSDKNPGIVHGSDAGTSARTKGSAGMGAGPGKMHGGMIRVDKVDSQGKKYHYWVHGTKGTRHEEPSEGSKQETHLHEADQKMHGQIVSAIHEHASPGDVKELTQKLNDWVEAKSAYVHLKEAHNQLAKESGGVPSSTVNMIAQKQSEHEKKFQAFKKAFAASAEKKMGKE